MQKEIVNIWKKLDYIQLEFDYWAIELKNDYFIFNSMSGEPFLVSKDDVEDIYNVDFEDVEYSPCVREKIQKVTDKYIQNYFGPIGLDLSVSEVCNLACPMCFHNIAITNTVTRNTIKLMSFEKAKKWIDYYIEYAKEHGIDEYTYHIGSAEPFVNRVVLWQVVDYIAHVSKNHVYSIYLNSNLTLINEEDVKKIKQYGVHIFAGLDGLKEANDSTRIYKADKKGTFDEIIGKIKMLIDGGVEVGINITLNNANFEKVDAKETVEFFNDIGIKSILIDSDVVTHIGYTSNEIVNKLMEFTVACEELGIISYGSWRIPFNMMTAQNSSEEPKSFCAARTGKNIVVTPSKGITFCTYSSDIMTDEKESPMEALSQYREKVRALMERSLPGKVKECEGCPLEGMCMGGCMLAHENHGEKNYMCDLYLEATKRLITHYFSEYVEE